MCVPLEEDEAVVLADYLRVKKIPFAHVPNEGVKKVVYMKKLARQGVSSGFPDYVVFLPHKLIAIELKRRDKKLSKVSDNQQEWLDTINCYEYATAYTAYGATEAIEIIENEMGWNRKSKLKSLKEAA
jgi:hypothetical protein